jgi:tRNA A37 threonylcarbamoyltransferase TsaD
MEDIRKKIIEVKLLNDLWELAETLDEAHGALLQDMVEKRFNLNHLENARVQKLKN